MSCKLTTAAALISPSTPLSATSRLTGFAISPVHPATVPLRTTMATIRRRQFICTSSEQYREATQYEHVAASDRAERSVAELRVHRHDEGCVLNKGARFRRVLGSLEA